MYADSSISTGFTKYAEKVNGRFATIGFVSLLATEILTGHSFIGLLKDILGWGIFLELVQTQIKKPGCCEKCCLQRHKLTQ